MPPAKSLLDAQMESATHTPGDVPVESTKAARQ
jgi:hypothetical protein